MKNSRAIVALTGIIFFAGAGAYLMLDLLRDGKPEGVRVNDARYPSVGARALVQGENYAESLISELRESRENNSDFERRIKLAEELNLAYLGSDSEFMRKRISDELSRALRNESDQRVARAIVFSHSRLGFDGNSLSNLKYAYEKKLIYFDDYYGELAHMYSWAPLNIRKDVVKEISESNNRYAVDIISGAMASAENVDLTKEEIADLHKFLTINEPIFGGSSDDFGFFEAILYSNWLRASSRLEKELHGVSVEESMGNKLLDPKTDPRAAVAFLVSLHAKGLSEAQKRDLQWHAIHARAQELIRRYPHAAGLQELGRQMEQ